MTVMDNTHVSTPGLPPQSGTASMTAAPGSSGPGSQMSITNAVVLTIGSAAAGLLVLGYIFRKGERTLPPIRIDAAEALKVYWMWLVIDGTLKLVAYRFHGHKVAQAYLLIA